MNYHYKKNSYISVEGGMAVASLAVSRKPYRDSLVYYNSAQPREQKSATWLSVANHHVLGRFDMGYGVYGGTHFANRYYRRFMQSDNTMFQQRYASLGFVALVYFRLTNALFAGVDYKPQLIAFTPSAKVLYEDNVSFGLSWRFGWQKR